MTLAGTRAYDATAAFAAATFGAAGTINTGVGGETLIVSGSGTVPSANAGAAQVLTLNTLALNDGTGLASNYTIAGAGNTGQVTPAALTAVSLVGAVTKTYNGNNTVTNLTTGNYSITGFVGGEGATITNVNGTYDNGANVVNNPAGSPVTSAVLVAGDYTANVGTLLSNYNLAAVTGVSATGNIGEITPAALSVTANNQNKIFGNTFIFTGNEFTPTGLQFGETIGSVTLTSAGAPAPAPVGPYPILASAATGGTFTASNYNISYVNGLMTVTSTTPPPPTPPQVSVNNLDGLINPILEGLQSLGIGVPPVEELLDCMIGDLGTPVDDGVAVSLPYRCVPAIPD